MYIGLILTLSILSQYTLLALSMNIKSYTLSFNNIMMNSRPVQIRTILLCLVFLLPICFGLQKTAVLRLQDIQTQQIYVRLENQQFTLSIYNTHFVTDPVIIFCFRVRTIVSAKNNFCEVGGVLDPYTCVEAVGSQANGAITNVAINTWSTDSTLTNTAITKTPLSSSLVTIGVSQVSINIHSFVVENTIYEAWAGYRIDLGNDPLSKNAFFNTFRIATQNNSDDLMAQRNPHCFEFYYENYINFNIVFYGGAIRGGNDTMFLHVLSYFAHQNKSVAIGSNMNGYIGLSLSMDHGDRDMYAFITANSTIFDMYSLYYSAPYLDESINIKGTTDVITLTDSASHTSGLNSHYFYGGIARLYDTGDTFGDELIRKKMNNTYCIAVGFHNLNNSFPYSPILPENEHIDYGCFTSFVDLWEPTFIFAVMGSLLLLLI